MDLLPMNDPRVTEALIGDLLRQLPTELLRPLAAALEDEAAERGA